MLNKLKKSNQGFTIIEVMIVLAIAGLIILIVLLAVPALQRNGRNTAIKNDASAVAAGISEFESNNDGKMPTNIAGTGTVAVTGGAGTTSAEAKVQGSTIANDVASVPGANAPAAGTISVYLGHKCGVAAANTRAAAVYYSIETASGTAQKCLDV
jgi:prepilin-type N-terminal cleavage/methylation domain-containing protein